MIGMKKFTISMDIKIEQYSANNKDISHDDSKHDEKFPFMPKSLLVSVW